MSVSRCVFGVCSFMSSVIFRMGLATLLSILVVDRFSFYANVGATGGFLFSLVMGRWLSSSLAVSPLSVRRLGQ